MRRLKQLEDRSSMRATQLDMSQRPSFANPQMAINEEREMRGLLSLDELAKARAADVHNATEEHSRS